MTIKIEAGKCYMTRDGRKVGPMVASGFEDWPWIETFGDGRCWTNDGLDLHPEQFENLIAEWTDEPDADADGLEYQRQNAPLPYGHARLPSGKVVDLTAITTPFGLLDAETREALRHHGGPYEYYNGDDWVVTSDCDDVDRMAHRVKPKPPAPVVGEVVAEWNTAYGFAGNDGPDDCKTTHRLTLPTQNGQLVPGTYTGPDGLVVKVEAL